MGVKVNCTEIKDFAQKIGTLNGQQREVFFQTAVRAMVGRLLALVIPRTPVGRGLKDADGKTIGHGGTLRRGWTATTENQAKSGSGKDATSYAQSMNVERTVRSYYRITITNPVKYASYVEYGHRQKPGRYVQAIGKRLKAAWVEGQFFLRLSEDDLRVAAPAILEPMLDALLRQVF